MEEQNREAAQERRKSKLPNREKLPIGDLLEPEQGYENEYMCWNLAQGNFASYKRLYEELPMSEVFRLNMLNTVREYYQNG